MAAPRPADRRVLDPRTLALIVLGGAAGTGIRALLTMPLGDPSRIGELAIATTAVNIVGSLLLGVVVGWLADRHPLARSFLGTGLLGGFTTYSAFALHVVLLASMRTLDGPFDAAPGVLVAAAVAAASVVGGLVAAVLGLWIGRRIAGSRGGVEPIEDAG